MFLTTLVLTTAALAQQEASFDRFLKEFSAKRQAIAFLEAPFTQTTISPDETVVSEGTVLYARPKRLLFRYTDPPQAYVLDGLRAYQYDPEFEQLQIFEIEDQPNTAAFFLGFEDNAERLLEAYDIRIFPREQSDEGGIGVELRPKPQEDEEPLFESVTLYLRGKDFLPTKINIVNDEESEVLILLGEITLSATVPQDEVRVFLPEGTDIIENERFVETVGPEGKYVPGPLDPNAE